MAMKIFSNEFFNSTTNGVSEAFDIRWAMQFSVLSQFVLPAIVGSPLVLENGSVESNVVTFPALAGATDGDFMTFPDTDGNDHGICLDTDGGGVANSGTVYTAIDTATLMNVVDISLCTDAASVAAAVVLVLPAAFTAMFDVTDNLDGTVTIAAKVRGLLSAPVPLDAAETGTGSITAVNTPGVDSAFDVAANTITAATHGMLTGQSVVLTNTGTEPDPLATGTTYYVIKVDASTFRLATTRDLAVAGTPVVLIDQGSAGDDVTLTPAANAGTLNIEYCTDIEKPLSTSSWLTHTSINLASASSPSLTTVVDNTHMWIRVNLALTSGTLTSCTSQVFGKGF